MKKYVIGFILGALLFTGVEVVASTIFASSVTYDNTTSGLKDSNDQDVTTVQDAIDTLYSTIENKIMTEIELSMTYSSTNNGGNAQCNISQFKKYYKYFKVTSNTCNEINTWANGKSSGFPITLNQAYLIADRNDGYTYSSVYVSDSSGWCTYKILLFN